MIEKTFAIIKPDAIASYKQGHIINRILLEKFYIKEMRQVTMTEDQVDNFYEEHKDKPFFNGLKSYMTSGPCIVLELEREDAVMHWRQTIGATNPKEAKNGTIRKMYGLNLDNNAVHGSDSVESAEKELEFFFG